MALTHLEELFESLTGNYDPIDFSPQDIKYNCIAWAAGDNTKRWWPIKLGGYWWPPELPLEETQENFVRAFELIGYRVCKDSNLKKGIEKVALYVDEQGVPTHMVRQSDSGEYAWTSKCGVDYEDIRHKHLSDLEGDTTKHLKGGYGRAVIFMHRRKDGKPFLKDLIFLFIKKLFYGKKF